MIPYGRQTIDDSDIEAVTSALRGDFLTTGPTIEAFEHAVAERVEAQHAVAFANGTAALHGACAAGGIVAGSSVATSALSFVASANCARFLGADIGFVDIDATTLNLNPGLVPPELDALIPVHFAGLPVALSATRNRPPLVIEDAAHALGAVGPDGPVGNCAQSEMTCFSFHPVKPVTTGEGGVVTTNNSELAEALRRFRSHGIVPHPDKGGWYYEVQSLAPNYRITDIQAALGLSQLRKLDTFIERRHELSLRYDELLDDLPIVRPPQAPTGQTHGHHLYAVRVDRRREVYDALRSDGIGVQVHYIPIHHHPIYDTVVADLPVTEAAYEQLLSLPLYPSLTEEQQDTVVTSLHRCIDELGIS